MKLKEPQIQKLSSLILNKLSEKNLIQLQKTSQDALKTIELVIKTDLQKEDKIEAEAKKMIEQYRSQIESGQIEYNKMYQMIKKELIKKHGFTV